MSTTFLGTIEVIIDCIEAIRRRPAMYAGSVDDRTPTALLLQALWLPLAQAERGETRLLTVELSAGGEASIAYDGPGLDLTPNAKLSTSRPVLAAETRFTVIEAPSLFEGREAPPMGLVVLNALSCSVEVCTHDSEHNEWSSEFARGSLVVPFTKTGFKSEKTSIRFCLDETILKKRDFHFNAVCEALEKSAPKSLRVFVRGPQEQGLSWHRRPELSAV